MSPESIDISISGNFSELEFVVISLMPFTKSLFLVWRVPVKHDLHSAVQFSVKLSINNSQLSFLRNDFLDRYKTYNFMSQR